MNTNDANSTHSSDDTSENTQTGDNLNREDLADSANGLDSTEVTDGQNGRNIRAMGSQDMDSENGVLRFNDTSNSTMEVTEEALSSVAASAGQTKTATTSVTTAGPDDYASDEEVGVPDAQKEAKKQDQPEVSADDKQEETASDIAETGTSLGNQPSY